MAAAAAAAAVLFVLSQRDKWKRKWPIENLSLSKFKQCTEIRKMAVIFEWIIFFGRQASLTFAPHPFHPMQTHGLAVFRNGLIVMKSKILQYIPVIIVGIIASYGYYDFWQWLFCKTNQRFLDASQSLCLATQQQQQPKPTMTTSTTAKRKQLPFNHTNIPHHTIYVYS